MQGFHFRNRSISPRFSKSLLVKGFLKVVTYSLYVSGLCIITISLISVESVCLSSFQLSSHSLFFKFLLCCFVEFHQLFLTLRKHSVCLGSQSQTGLNTHAIKPQNISIGFMMVIITRKCPLFFVLNVFIPNECFVFPKCFFHVFIEMIMCLFVVVLCLVY